MVVLRVLWAVVAGAVGLAYFIAGGVLLLAGALLVLPGIVLMGAGWAFARSAVEEL